MRSLRSASSGWPSKSRCPRRTRPERAGRAPHGRSRPMRSTDHAPPSSAHASLCCCSSASRARPAPWIARPGPPCISHPAEPAPPAFYDCIEPRLPPRPRRVPPIGRALWAPDPAPSRLPSWLARTQPRLPCRYLRISAIRPRLGSPCLAYSCCARHLHPQVGKHHDSLIMRDAAHRQWRQSTMKTGWKPAASPSRSCHGGRFSACPLTTGLNHSFRARPQQAMEQTGDRTSWEDREPRTGPNGNRDWPQAQIGKLSVAYSPFAPGDRISSDGQQPVSDADTPLDPHERRSKA